MTFSRRNVIIGAVAATWLVLLLLTFFLVRSSQQNQRKAILQVTPTAAQINREATEIDKQNLLINQSEIEQAERDYNSKVGKSSTVIKQKPSFTFEVAPSLKKAVSPTPAPQRKVLAAATTCNIDSAPSTVYVYDLKSHWVVEDAAALAKEYGVESPSYSLPTEASTFQYQFTSKDNSKFFNLYEASGKYRYHEAGGAMGPNLDPGAIQDKSNAFITAHRLNNKIQPPQAQQAGTTTLFKYNRVLDNFKLTDNAGVQAALASSLCNVVESEEMGNIQVDVRQDGKISNLFNNTRTILGSYKANRLSLEEAVAEYGASQPVAPIVIPPAANINVATVPIDTAVLAYYDMGGNFGQTLYIPMYIGMGTVGGARVIGFFPAVSATELLKKGLVRQIPSSGSASSQQQGTIGFATPTPHAPPPPPVAGPVTMPGDPASGEMLGCPGELVDYRVTCSVAGRTVCINMFSSSSANDPMGACNSGCKEVSGTVSYQSGTSPCNTFVQQKNIPPAGADGFDMGPVTLPGGDGQLQNGDQVSCSLGACPC